MVITAANDEVSCTCTFYALAIFTRELQNFAQSVNLKFAISESNSFAVHHWTHQRLLALAKLIRNPFKKIIKASSHLHK
jgi:hypothetical protein